MSDLKPALEALIFISVEPLTMDKIREVLPERSEEEISAALEELASEFESGPRAIRLTQTGGGWVFSTKPDYDAPVRKLLQIERRKKLSPAALETLSVVAYHQPATAPEVMSIRGVDSTTALHTLLENKLVKISGRRDAPGRPLLYRTTEKFLAYFGLNSLDDLPQEEELRKILEAGNA
ncbi:MAG: SMC-Scp complex subunit ScpB [Candidatus Aminicenantes bacterium]|nr:SMC-Scp complex subunit ScpB [Candidatus Aminicenantes bacterium]